LRNVGPDEHRADGSSANAVSMSLNAMASPAVPSPW
jgi:hypothetical protein